MAPGSGFLGAGSLWRFARLRAPCPQLALGGVPETVLRNARAAFDRRDVDTALAVEVTAPCRPERVGGRRLRFATQDLSLDVLVRRQAGALVMRVVVRPRSVVTVVVRHGDRSLTARTDARGRCRLARVRSGPVSLLVRHGESKTATTWTIL